MNKIIAVSQNIFTELKHRKILSVNIFYLIIMLITSMWITELSPGAEIRVVKDAGFAIIELFGFLIVLLSISVLSFEEIELRTIWLSLVKPIERYEYFLGKAVGIVLVVLLNLFLMSLILVFVCLISKIALDLSFFAIIIAIFFKMVIAIVATLIISVLASSLISQIILSSIIIMLGHIIHYLKILIKNLPGISKIFLMFFYYLIPNFNYFNIKDIIYMESSMPNLHVWIKMFFYMICYTGLGCLVAMIIFQKKEFK